MRNIVIVVLGVVAIIGALFGYFLYTPDPEVPKLSGTLSKATIEIDGKAMTYRTYFPKSLAKGVPLVFVMHGSGQNGSQIRLETGYEFERLADQFGFGVVYPSASSFDWNDCSKVGDFQVDGKDFDHVKFLSSLADKLIAEKGFDPKRVFATGVSSGGLMSLRLAIEAPSRFRAVAAVSANLPAKENFKCTVSDATTSVLLMNGTQDPIVYFEGGETSLLGLFYKGGFLQSSKQTAQFFVEQNELDRTGSHDTVSYSETSSDGDVVKFEREYWKKDAGVEVELITIHGGGHGMPQAYWKRPRLLGPSPMAPNGPAMIWNFFFRQSP